jgi:hypothetical protein
MKLTKILGSPIAFHRCLAELAGSVTSGLMLSQAVYWTGKTKDPQGWFWKTQDEWFEETMLSRKEQESARRRLREIAFQGESLWCEQLRGVPAKLYYRVNMDILECLLTADQHVQNVQASMPQTDILEGPKGANKQAQNGHTFLLAETTTEITSETTAESVVESPTAISAKPHTPQTEDAVSIALEYFPQMGIWQQELIRNADINHLALWRQTMQIWSDHKWSKGNIHGMIDKYHHLESQDIKHKEYRNNGKNGSTTRQTAGERKASEYLELQRKLGQNASNDPDYKPLPGFEWLDAIR